MELKEVVKALGVLAPLKMAEKWDNVGLLLEPTVASGKTPLAFVFLTNDLTESVLEEVIELKKKHEGQPALIVSYHPPLFESFKRMLCSDVKQRIAIRCIENGLAIYSPHTACDSVEGGVNDWLISGMGKGKVAVIKTRWEKSATQTIKLVNYLPEGEPAAKLRQALGDAGAGVIGNYSHCTFSTSGTGTFKGNEKSNPAVGEKGKLEDVKEERVEVMVSRSQLEKMAEVIDEVHPYEEPAWEVFEMSDVPTKSGAGRSVRLDEKVPISEIVKRVKQHLNLPHIRLAVGQGQTLESEVSKVAVCAGAGSSVLKGVQAEVYVTGEMSHHEVIAAVHSGTTVVLCEHSNTERGYLRQAFQKKLDDALHGKVPIFVSTVDADPLVVY